MYQVDQEDIEEFLSVGKALKINGLKEPEPDDANDTVSDAGTASKHFPTISDVKEEPIEVDCNNGIQISEPKSLTYKYTVENVMFPSPTNSNQHYGEEFSCDMCYFTTEKKSILKKHKMSTHDTEEASYEPTVNDAGLLPCHLCDFEAISKQSYKKHMVEEHNNVKHMAKKHFGRRIKKYHCDMCDFKASRLKHLKQHKLNRHDEGKPYPCDRCDYQAISAHILKIHKTSKHDRVQYNCEMCDYTTNWQANLTTHKRKKHTEPQEDLQHLQVDYESPETNYEPSETNYEPSEIDYVPSENLDP